MSRHQARQSTNYKRNLSQAVEWMSFWYKAERYATSRQINKSFEVHDREIGNETQVYLKMDLSSWGLLNWFDFPLMLMSFKDQKYNRKDIFQKKAIWNSHILALNRCFLFVKAFASDVWSLWFNFQYIRNVDLLNFQESTSISYVLLVFVKCKMYLCVKEKSQLEGDQLLGRTVFRKVTWNGLISWE